MHIAKSVPKILFLQLQLSTKFCLNDMCVPKNSFITYHTFIHACMRT